MKGLLHHRSVLHALIHKPIMKSLQKTTKELKAFHLVSKGKIEKRLGEFVEVFKVGKDNDIFAELVFCLLTPQSKAKSCWAAVNELTSKKLLHTGSSAQIAKVLQSKTRFHNNKAKYVVLARKLFQKGITSTIKSFSNIHDLREWLVVNVKGMGYKEAGHFLRNIGFGKDIAILDRHILKNLKQIGVIKEMPKTLSKKVYFDIEKKMLKFAKKIGIPADHLDLLFWSKQTGEIFK